MASIDASLLTALATLIAVFSLWSHVKGPATMASIRPVTLPMFAIGYGLVLFLFLLHFLVRSLGRVTISGSGDTVLVSKGLGRLALQDRFEFGANQRGPIRVTIEHTDWTKSVVVDAGRKVRFGSSLSHGQRVFLACLLIAKGRTAGHELGRQITVTGTSTPTGM